MRTNSVATTGEDWLRLMDSKAETQARFENFNIIGTLKDHKEWYEDDPTQAAAGATMSIKNVRQVQKEYLEFTQHGHTSVLNHYENFLANLAKYE